MIKIQRILQMIICLMLVLSSINCTKQVDEVKISKKPVSPPIKVDKIPASTFVFQLDADPAGSKYRITTSDGSITGVVPFSGSLPAGVLTYEIEHEGLVKEKGTLDLQKDQQVYHCLDRAGQLVQCQRRIRLPVHPWTDKALPRDERIGGPKAVLISPDSKEVWVAILVGSPAIRIYEIATGKEITSIKLGEFGAVEFALSQDKSKVYVSQLESHSVFEIDLLTKKRLRTFSTGGEFPKVLELSADGKSLFASNWITGDIGEIDLKTGKLRRMLKTVRVPRGLHATPDGKYLYVAGFGKGKIQRINLKTEKGVTIHNKSRALRHIVADEKRDLLYISAMGNRKILRLDLKSGEVEFWARTSEMPNTIHLSPDGRMLFVSCRGRNNPSTYLDPGPEWGSVLIFDTATKKLLDVIVQGNQPTALDLSPDGRLLISSDFVDNRLNIYTVPSYEELQKGAGGRASVYLKDLTKPNWKVWRPAPSKKKKAKTSSK